MAPPFVIPDSLKDLEEMPDDEDRLYAHDVTELESLSPSEVDELVKGVAFDLADKELFCVEEQNVFDQIYSLVRGFSCLEPAAKGNFIESLRSNFSVLLPNITSLSWSASPSDGPSLQDRINSCRNALKIYTFFLQTIIFTEEAHPEQPSAPRANSGKGKNSRKKHIPQAWNWEVHRSKSISILATAVETDLKQLYGQSDPEENFLAFVSKGAFALLENPSLSKDKDTKDALCRIIGACATKYHYTMQASASLLHLIHKYDFLPQHIADAVAQAEKKYNDGSLAVALIREIGRMSPKDYARDASGAENVGRFLVELADRLPKLMSTNVVILMPHFGGESYKIRSSLVGVFGKLVSKAFKDIDGNSASGTHRLRSKQAMLDVLLERCRDVSAYTRSRVLQTWAELCEEHAVSMGLWNQVSEIAAGRLEDKSAMVRKSALNLLSTLLQYNPFGPQLRTTSFEATLEKYKEKLSGMTSSSPSNDNEANSVVVKTEISENNGGEIISNNDLNDSVAEESQSPEENGEIVQNHVEDSGPSQVETGMDDNDNTPDVGSLEQTRALVASLEAGVRFAKCIASTMPILVQLLASPMASDVEHGIQLLIRCRQFQIDGAESCLRKMLPLVFSQEKAIYEAVEGAFLTIYIKKNSMETALNLINLTIDSSIGDLAALEFIVSVLVNKGDITSGTISALWDFFTFNVNGVTAARSRGALSVLCMAAKSSPKILSSRLLNIIDIGFGRWAKEEPLLPRTACIALQRLSQEDRESLLSCNSRVFNALQSLIIGSGLPEQSWYAAAEQAINAIYALHPMPEMFSADIIQKFHGIVFGQNETQDLVTADAENQKDEASLPHDSLSVPANKLSRFLFIVSHIALKHLVYIESCARKVRKQKADKERAAAESQASENDADFSQSSDKTIEESNINAELGVSASEDARLDSLAENAEKEIISGRQNQKFIIGVCAPIVAKLCRNFALLQKFPALQASAMLALCKLMVIDADFCDANLQLLFTVAKNADSESVRSNCTIALGDLAVRFPNLLEPWTEHMYARLNDQAQSVRKNSVLVLSHLILNDMMKVKGYISEMALRLEDEDPRISNLVKLFFHELSKKGNNPIYNLLPDILSRLSSQNLSEETFCNIMQFLIGSIKKDKQMEGLIEKLCHRFYGVTDKKQWVDIAFCLSQLTYTEKGFKKLADLFKSYEHALPEDAVIDCFKTITNKAKKFAKPEVKSSVEDFEEKLIKCHEEKKEQELTMQNAMAHQQKVAGPMESEKLSPEESSCVTGIEAHKDGGLAEEDSGLSNNISQESTRDAAENFETHQSTISESGDLPDSRYINCERNLDNEISPTATKSCRKGKSKSKLKKNPKLEVPIMTDEGESSDVQTSPAKVQSEIVLPGGDSITTVLSDDNKGVTESCDRPICDNEHESETIPSEIDPGNRVRKGTSRRKKTVHLNVPTEGSEGSLTDEEKENKTKQFTQTPATRSSRKTRQQREKITPQTRTLRRR